MNNHSYWNRSNLLKGIGILCVLIFGYYAHQDNMNRNILERSLNENAAPQQRDFHDESSRLHAPSAPHENGIHKATSEKTQHTVSRDLNDYDTFNEHLDEYLEDPEDEITYPPEIYDALIDKSFNYTDIVNRPI